MCGCGSCDDSRVSVGLGIDVGMTFVSVPSGSWGTVRVLSTGEYSTEHTVITSTGDNA